MLTFGNPLRQLLNRFFPHLYWWVKDIPDNSLGHLQASSPKKPTPDDMCETPDPKKLRLTRWVSAYRSGDFVGRSLWLDHWYNRNDQGPDHGQYGEPPTISTSQSGAVEELCIGIGGHNYYWDRSAPDIAEQLDKLINS